MTSCFSIHLLIPDLLGTPGDYNQWAALGCDGWGYDDVAPYFVKSGYDDVAPYFVKSEHARSHSESRYRGKAGQSSLISRNGRLSGLTGVLAPGPWQNQQFEDAPYKLTPL